MLQVAHLTGSLQMLQARLAQIDGCAGSLIRVVL
jgi:hypothetical protein